MAPRKRITLEQWIGQALSDPDKGKPCSALSLVHLKGMSKDEVHTKQLEGANHSAQQLADFFESRACGYCQDLAGYQTFQLLAFYGQNEPQATHNFTASEGQLTGGQDVPFSKHEPTQTGMLAQLMKHNEQIMAMNQQLVQTFAVAGIQREQQMRTEVQEAQMIVRDVIFNMRKETHEWKLKELEFQRSTQERQMIGKVIPSVINHLTGREVMPEGHADSELIDALAMKVKPEQLHQLMSLGLIPQELGALLAARFAKAAERRKQEAEALKVLPPEGEEQAAQ